MRIGGYKYDIGLNPLNSSFAYAKPKGNNDTNDNDLVPLGARANAIKFITKTGRAAAKT